MPKQNPDASLLLTGDPGAHCEGRIGRTLADSMPHWK